MFYTQIKLKLVITYPRSPPTGWEVGTADDALVRMAEVEQTKQRWVPGRPDGASIDAAG